MTTAFFIRHGLTRENQQERVQGQLPGTILPQENEHYLAAVVPLLRQHQIDLIISSDLDRAQATANTLREFLHLPHIEQQVSPLLREKAMGFYEGMLWRDVPLAFRQQRHMEDYDFRAFGGENQEDVRARVQTMLRRLTQIGFNRNICCVTHAGWIRQLVRIANKEGVLPDGWSDRTAIYQAQIKPPGQLISLIPLPIHADLPDNE